VDGDVETAGRIRAGVNSAAVNGGDRRHQCAPQAEAVVAGAVVGPGERQEQAIDLIRRDDGGRC
jgi:hypothetical protein